MRAALLALTAAALVIVAGVASLVASVTTFLEDPRAISSTSGLTVFLDDGTLVAYPVYEPGLEPTIIGAGIVLLVGALFVAAISYRSTSLSLASTADSNALAQTR